MSRKQENWVLTREKGKKDCEYVAVEVQDHPAQYKGLITTKKTQKIRLELPPGLSAPDPAQQISVFYDFLEFENIFRMDVAPKTLKVNSKLHWLFSTLFWHIFLKK